MAATVDDRASTHISGGRSRPEPTIVIRPSQGLLRLELKAIWEYRELLYFLIWRELKVRYKQTIIGAAWAILQPLMTMGIFTVVFGKFAGLPSDGRPYPLFSYAALLPWSYFSQAVVRSAASLVGDANLISKVYFPRLLVPLSCVVAPLVDLAAAFLALVAMMGWFHIVPTWEMLTLPLFVFLALMTALAVALWLSALNVQYRDVGHAIPFLIQFWMFASPLVYPVSLVPPKWQLIYSINPLVGVIEGFRWALLGLGQPNFTVIAASAGMVIVLLGSGIIYFKWAERTFADVV